MFSTCLFCHASLGDNRSIEHFPVGRRLAFDAERGRLWAVCPRCARWNLSPIEERWEAVEECERAYRGATQRVSTDHIALARLADGTDLVRIGRPLFPEFAAWRYGGEFLKRSWRTAMVLVAPSLLINGGTVGSMMLIGTIPAVGAYALTAGLLGLGVGLPIARTWNRSALLVMIDGELHGLSRYDLRDVTLRRDELGAVAIRFRSRAVTQNYAALRALGLSMRRAAHSKYGEREVGGGAALDMLRRALPLVNAAGGSTHDVKDAVAMLEVGALSLPGEGPTAHLLLSAPRDARNGASIGGIAARYRLAAEMALHEDDERLAMSGELGALYARWEEAERTAKIADALSLSLQAAAG